MMSSTTAHTTEQTVEHSSPPEQKQWQPKILAYCCNWCSYAGADLAGTSRIQYPPNARILRVNCTGRISPEFILAALEMGADGVLVSGCHPGDCHYTSGNLKLRARWALLEKTIEQAGVDPRRVRLQWASASEAQIFADGVRILTEQVRKLGPIERDWK